MNWLFSFLFRRSPPAPAAKRPSETVVATAHYQTVWQTDGKEVGTKTLHVMILTVRGGSRFARVETSNTWAANEHSVLVADRSNWIHHGDLPSHGRRVESKGSVTPLRIVDGGAA